MSVNQVAGVTSLEPVGVEGCHTCQALSGSRELAREAGEAMAVASCNQQIGNHPHSGLPTDTRRLPVVTVWGVAV
jgi:hypothetical protein